MVANSRPPGDRTRYNVDCQRNIYTYIIHLSNLDNKLFWGKK